MSANDTAISEMRKKDRIDVTEVVMVIDRPTGKPIGQLVNISEEGIMIMGSQPIEENCILQLTLTFDNTVNAKPEINIGVESLWSHTGSDQAQFWTGFYIIDISEQDLARIREMTEQNQ